MIHKKRIQALGLACLVGLMSLGPAAESLAAVSWTKNNGVYIGSDGTSIAGVVARGIDVSHWKQAGKPSQATISSLLCLEPGMTMP